VVSLGVYTEKPKLVLGVVAPSVLLCWIRWRHGDHDLWRWDSPTLRRQRVGSVHPEIV